MSTPNVYADMIEHMCEHMAHRKHFRVSLHTHNDRGCGVAAGRARRARGAIASRVRCSATVSAPATWIS